MPTLRRVSQASLSVRVVCGVARGACRVPGGGVLGGLVLGAFRAVAGAADGLSAVVVVPPGGVDLGAEEQCDAGEPQPDGENDGGCEGAVDRVVGAERRSEGEEGD